MKEQSEPSKEETKLQSEQKTLQECKDYIARDCGFQDWGHIVESYNPKKLVDLTDEVAELYASQFKSQLPIEQTRSAGEILQDKFNGLESKINKPNVYQTPLIVAAMEEYLSEYSQAYQLRQSELVNQLYARIKELESQPLPIEGGERYTVEDMKESFVAGAEAYMLCKKGETHSFKEWLATRKGSKSGE